VHRHHRRSIRLKAYDYTQPGAYFVTICTHRRAHLFGRVVDGEMVTNAFGEIVRQEWFKTARVRPYVVLHEDEFVIMPNHIHGIIWIVDIVGATRRVAPTTGERDDPSPAPIAPTGKRGAPTTERDDPTTAPIAPTTERDDPTTAPTAPTGERGTPTTGRDNPTTGRDAPTTAPIAPTGERGSPTTGRDDPTTGRDDPTTAPTAPTGRRVTSATRRGAPACTYPRRGSRNTGSAVVPAMRGPSACPTTRTIAVPSA